MENFLKKVSKSILLFDTTFLISLEQHYKFSNTETISKIFQKVFSKFHGLFQDSAGYFLYFRTVSWNFLYSKNISLLKGVPLILPEHTRKLFKEKFK